MHALGVMTSLSLAKLLELTQAELVRLHGYYVQFHEHPPSDARSMFAEFLSQREAHTIAALDRYRAHDEDHPALDVHVRLGWGFPFTDKPELPEQPGVDQLIEIAKTSDAQLEQIGERIRLYAAAMELNETLAAIETLALTRRHQLAGALRELDEFAYRSTPPGSMKTQSQGSRTAMTEQPQREETIEKLRSLLDEFDDAMLVSIDAHGHPHARPMRIAAREQEQHDDLWFVTSVDSAKIAELRRDPHVAVTMADGSRYLSISGRAEVVEDRAKIHEMWREPWRVWFPKGPDSDNIALIQVRPQHAEYWDQSLPHGIRLAYEAAKAWITGKRIETPDEPELHARIEFE
jgi:general stress protein 26